MIVNTSSFSGKVKRSRKSNPDDYRMKTKSPLVNLYRRPDHSNIPSVTFKDYCKKEQLSQ
jgi:hypothetical protein